MRFGSVGFFKVLIKTVLTILFFVPLILAVVFGALFASDHSKLENTQKENTRLSAITDVLVNEKVGTAEDFLEIFQRSGVSFDEFLTLISKNKNVDAKELYNTLSGLGMSDKDIIALALSKGTVGSGEFFDILTKNGITTKDIVSAAIGKNGGSTADYCRLLEECGLSDEEIINYFTNKKTLSTQSGSSEEPILSENSSESVSGSSESVSSTPEAVSSSSQTVSQSVPESSADEQSKYADLYEDMYVSSPANYVRSDGTIYLTFDDGPCDNTYSILQILRQRNVKATFFVVPTRTEACYSLLKAIAADGHSIGVHSATHEYEVIYSSVESYLADFYEAWDIIRDATGITTQIFRFPGGSKNDFDVETRDAIIKEMTRRGFRYYDWNVESGDVAGADWSTMYNNIPLDCAKNYRSIVLFHDTQYNTVLVLDDVLGVLINEGYKFDKINNNTEPVQFIGPFS